MKVLMRCYLILLWIYVIASANVPTKSVNSRGSTKFTTTAPATESATETTVELQRPSTFADTRGVEFTTVVPKLSTATGIKNLVATVKVTKKPSTTNLPVTTPKRLPPKKYAPTTAKPRNNPTNGPTRFILPKPNLRPPTDVLTCPKANEAEFQLFALPCKSDRDCTAWNKEHRCCQLFGSRNCIKGVPKPLEEQLHSPILGLIPRKCPRQPLAELWWELKTCETDNDCWPRVCCPDGHQKYCRTSTPEYEAVPSPIARPLAYFSEYLECTPPPPPVFDIHPKGCNSTLDCFPNVCCQEAGKKHCRPPKKSVLTFMANFLNTGLLRRLTENLVIR